MLFGKIKYWLTQKIECVKIAKGTEEHGEWKEHRDIYGLKFLMGLRAQVTHRDLESKK